MIRTIALVGVYASCVLSLAGCASSSHTGVSSNSTTPAASSTTVAGVTPASGATGVDLNAAIQVTFSSFVTPGTVDAANIQVAGAQPVVGAVTYDSGSDVATFTPSAALAANTKYTVTVAGVTDSTGKAVTSFTSTFTTGQTTAAAGDNTVQYQASLFAAAPAYTGSGQIYILTCGCVAVQTTGAQASTTYSVSFCPAYPASQPAPSCISVGSIETDANGDADQMVHFPQPGNWAGDFQLAAGSTVQYATGMVPPASAGGSSEVYLATLEPLTTVNAGALEPSGSSPAQSSLSAGTVTWFNGALQISIAGGAANASYIAVESTDALGGSASLKLSNSQQQSAFPSDGNGNLNFSVLQDGSEGDMFELEPQNSQAGFIGGFTVPN